MRKIRQIALLLLPTGLLAQTTQPASNDAMSAVLERLDRLEKQNRELMDEIRKLREEVAQNSPRPDAAPPPESLAERVDVVEKRVDEQAQSKVESSQKFPVSLTGALLFNAYAGSKQRSFVTLSGPDRSGATVRQTILGLSFHGPDLPGGGKASGELSLDFAGGAGPGGYEYSSGLALRRGVLNLDWPRRSVMLGQDKALLSRREPDSLAEVLIPPLASSGNPWYWVPQARYTERVHAGERTGLDIEAAVLQTDEYSGYLPDDFRERVDPARPAFEQRTNFWTTWGDEGRLELGAGFHVSNSHVSGHSVPSRFGSIDWLVRPSRIIEFKGLFFGGENMSLYGGFSNGFSLSYWSPPRPVHGFAGWAQASVHLTPRLTWNIFAGSQASRLADIYAGSPTHDFTYASNLIYRLSPNILVGMEALQERSGVLAGTAILHNHYDLALGYLF